MYDRLLHPGQGDPTDEIFLEEDKDQQNRQGRNHRASKDDIPDGLVFEDKQRQSELQGAKFGIADDDQRPEEVVPDESKGENRLRSQNGTAKRHDNFPVDEEFGRAIHPRRVQEVVGDALHVLAHEEDAPDTE